MFADYIKMAAKIALIAVITTAIIVLFAGIQFPVPDFAPIFQYAGKGLAIINYWVPFMATLLPIALSLIGVRLAIYLFKFAMIAVKWIMKVNE